MSCSFRLTTTRPDGKREDIPLGELVESPEFEEALFDGLDIDGLLGLSPDGVDIEGNAKFALSTTLNDNPGVVAPITGEQLLGELEYTESERVVEQVVVGTAPNQVVIDRMVSVTFVGPVGGSLRLIFDNPD